MTHADDTFRIGVDVGGTFTDVTALSSRGHLAVDKALTSTTRFWDGASEALALVAREFDLELRELLARTSLFVLGTTRATNAVVENTTARTAYVATEGFPDTLVLRQGGKEQPFNFGVASPEPYVPKKLTFEIPERINQAGDVLRPLNRDGAMAVLDQIGSAGVDSVAVALLWSIANPSHELELAELIEARLPGLPYTLSHQLNPILGEYRRASSSAIDASLKPVMQSYIGQMREDLRAEGLAGELLIATCYGGSIPVDGLIDRPILSVNSGPSLAPVAARLAVEQNLGTDNVIVCDVGGTTFDVSLVQAGEIKKSRDTWIGPPFTGHLTGFSAVDVKSVGAGGGSIAWVDEAGLLNVGPESAGADPGPACYGRGGARPTFTDAAVCLGYLDADRFLGGRMRLDVDAAARAIDEHVAKPLGLDLHRAAHGIMAVGNETMITALTDVTIKAGVDPRDYVVVAGGGGAGLGILAIAEALDCRNVLVPRSAPVLSATGALLSEVVVEFGMSHACSLDRFPAAEVNAGLEALEERLDGFVADLPPAAVEEIEKRFSVEARYHGQAWEIEVVLPGSRLVGADDVEALRERFHEAHERAYGVRQPDEAIECTHWTARLVGRSATPSSAPRRAGGEAVAEASGPAYFARLGMVETPRLDGASLPPDHAVEGPAIITEPLTTIVVHPGWVARTSTSGDYVITREAPPTG